MKPLLYNCAFILLSEANALSFKYKRNYSPIYTEEDVATTLNYIYEYDNVHELYVLDEIVSFKWFENSHCLGARQLQLILKDQNGVSNSILYTSDIGSLNTKIITFQILKFQMFLIKYPLWNVHMENQAELIKDKKI